MRDALEGHVSTDSIGGRQLTNFKLSDNIDGHVDSETELQQLVGRIERASKNYRMEISGELTKLMTNNNNDMPTDVQIDWNTLDEVQTSDT